ncbi:hypothetical protein TNCV_2137651 [Trichonephila clavipes]|nr:hypothetical protein TNCV_2137651 [Trichonephila clavipes]
MNLFDRKELLAIEKESLPVLTCDPSQKFSASLKPCEFFFVCLFCFCEILNFSQLAQHQPKLLFAICSTDLLLISMSRVICLIETLGFLRTRFSMALRFLKVFTVRFHPLLGRSPSLQALQNGRLH